MDTLKSLQQLVSTVLEVCTTIPDIFLLMSSLSRGVTPDVRLSGLELSVHARLRYIVCSEALLCTLRLPTSGIWSQMDCGRAHLAWPLNATAESGARLFMLHARLILIRHGRHVQGTSRKIEDLMSAVSSCGPSTHIDMPRLPSENIPLSQRESADGIYKAVCDLITGEMRNEDLCGRDVLIWILARRIWAHARQISCSTSRALKLIDYTAGIWEALVNRRADQARIGRVDLLMAAIQAVIYVCGPMDCYLNNGHVKVPWMFVDDSPIRQTKMAHLVLMECALTMHASSCQSWDRNSHISRTISSVIGVPLAVWCTDPVYDWPTCDLKMRRAFYSSELVRDVKHFEIGDIEQDLERLRTTIVCNATASDLLEVNTRADAWWRVRSIIHELAPQSSLLIPDVSRGMIAACVLPYRTDVKLANEVNVVMRQMALLALEIRIGRILYNGLTHQARSVLESHSESHKATSLITRMVESGTMKCDLHVPVDHWLSIVPPCHEVRLWGSTRTLWDELDELLLMGGPNVVSPVMVLAVPCDASSWFVVVSIHCSVSLYSIANGYRLLLVQTPTPESYDIMTRAKAWRSLDLRAGSKILMESLGFGKDAVRIVFGHRQGADASPKTIPASALHLLELLPDASSRPFGYTGQLAAAIESLDILEKLGRTTRSNAAASHMAHEVDNQPLVRGSFYCTVQLVTKCVVILCNVDSALASMTGNFPISLKYSDPCIELVSRLTSAQTIGQAVDAMLSYDFTEVELVIEMLQMTEVSCDLLDLVERWILLYHLYAPRKLHDLPRDRVLASIQGGCRLNNTGSEVLVLSPTQVEYALDARIRWFTPEIN